MDSLQFPARFGAHHRRLDRVAHHDTTVAVQPQHIGADMHLVLVGGQQEGAVNVKHFEAMRQHVQSIVAEKELVLDATLPVARVDREVFGRLCE